MSKSKLRIFAKFASMLSTLSKCTEGAVAAIIVSPDYRQVLSIGINGGAGQSDCLCHLGDKYKCIHAEMNALAKCTQSTKDCIMIVTKPPCATCAALIINAGISEVYFKGSYHDNTGTELLRANGVVTRRLLVD